MCPLALVLALLLPATAGAAVGDVYVTDEDAGGILRLAPTGGNTAELLAMSPAVNQDPTGIAFLRSGDLVMADEDEGGLFVVDRVTGIVTTFATLPAPANDVALHPDGRIIAVDGAAGDLLYAVDPVTKAVSTFRALPSGTYAYGVAIGRDGTAYVGDAEGSRVLRVSPAGATTTLSSSPLFLNPEKLALSADERTLFVANPNLMGSPPGSVLRVDTATGATSSLGSADTPRAVAVRPDRSVLAGDVSSDEILSFGPSGGAPTTFSSDPDLLFPRDMLVEPPPCGGRFATAVGTTGRDVLRGSRYGDVFAALGGNDVVRGLGGNDVVCGGAGRDRLIGGKGRDRLLGGPGPDVLRGGPGRDRLRGGPGRDRQKQ